jgi:8-oxo-dGTP diphosphatase
MRVRAVLGTPQVTEFVAGFLLGGSPYNTVALVRKERPEWQRGRLNGIGGHIESGESPAEAMRREFFEEAGLDIDTWEHFATVEGDWGRVYFFRAWGEPQHAKTCTDEEIVLESSFHVPSSVVPNLQFLLPLARYHHDIYEPVVFKEM